MSETIQLSVDGRDFPATLSLPEGDTVGPAVVVIHDLTGHRDDTVRHCENFAAAGYVAIAPDLFGGGSLRCIVSTVAKLVKGENTPPEIAVAQQFLVDHPRVDPGRIGITGFCMGGGFALLGACDGGFAVAAPFYGRAPSKERLKRICPTLGQFGHRDVIFKREASKLSKHLTALGVDHEVIVYEGVGHSFMNDHPDLLFKLGWLSPLQAFHDGPTEAIAWAKLLEFFEQHMGAPSTPT